MWHDCAGLSVEGGACSATAPALPPPLDFFVDVTVGGIEMHPPTHPPTHTPPGTLLPLPPPSHLHIHEAGVTQQGPCLRAGQHSLVGGLGRPASGSHNGLGVLGFPHGLVQVPEVARDTGRAVLSDQGIQLGTT
jgi:hypothetical protein